MLIVYVLNIMNVKYVVNPKHCAYDAKKCLLKQRLVSYKNTRINNIFLRLINYLRNNF